MSKDEVFGARLLLGVLTFMCGIFAAMAYIGTGYTIWIFVFGGPLTVLCLLFEYGTYLEEQENVRDE